VASKDPKIPDLEPPPWAKVREITLIRREVREFLAPDAVEILFGRAESLVEAGIDPDETTVYATVMVTIDLVRCHGIQETADAATAARLAPLLAGDRTVADRLRQLARPYLCDLAKRSVKLANIELEHSVRAEGTRLLLDGDAMVSVATASARGRR